MDTQFPRIKRHYEPSDRVSFETTGDSLTHQSEAAACDINQIMQRWQRTGVIDHRNKYEGQYADFTNTPTDYHESMNAVLAADDMFQTLPSSVRKRFHNDPGHFLEFAQNPDNASELVKMGLAKQRDFAPGEVLETLPKEPKTPLKKAPDPQKSETD